jgi:hypothetical protein
VRILPSQSTLFILHFIVNENVRAQAAITKNEFSFIGFLPINWYEIRQGQLTKFSSKQLPTQGIVRQKRKRGMNMPKQSHRTAFIYKFLMVAALAFLLAGCASTPKMSYTGEPLPDNQIARISVEVKERSWEDALLAKRPNQIFITHVDQQPLGSFWSVDGSAHKVVDLLPGERSIAVAR